MSLGWVSKVGGVGRSWVRPALGRLQSEVGMSGRRLAVVGRELCAMLEAVHLVTYMSEEPVEEFEKLGWAGHWPGYFASRSAPLGKVPAAVVDALFYNFAPGEVAAYIPGVWEIATPEQALAAREAGSVRALRRILGKLADSPAVERAAELATRAAFAAPSERRILYAALRTLPVPEEPLARLWHASTLLREHRGDGHYAALVTAGVGGQECHVLEALWLGMPAREYGRLYPLSDDELAAVVEGMRGRGLVGADGG